MGRPVRRIVVVGGGFAGLYAASQLGRSDLGADGAEITLIDRKNYFTFTPLLAEVAAGNLSREHVIQGYRSLGRRYGFTFLQGEVLTVDPVEQVVVTADNRYPYDYAILAPGAEPGYFGNADLPRHSCPLVSVDDAVAIHDRVVHAMEEAARTADTGTRDALLTIIVAGAGPAGVETAGELHHFANDVLRPYYPGLPPVRVLVVSGGDRILPGFDDTLAAGGLVALRKMGVEVELDTLVTGASAGCVETKGPDGVTRRMRTGTLIWTAGTQPASWLATCGLPQERGSLQVLPTLQVAGCETLFAAGDAAGLVDPRTDRGYPKVAPIALSQGVRAAGNIENLVYGRPLEEYHAHHAGKIVSLGRGVAFADVLGFQLRGRAAWWMYRTAYTLKLIGLKNKVRVVMTLLFNRIFERDIAAAGARPAPPPPLDPVGS